MRVTAVVHGLTSVGRRPRLRRTSAIDQAALAGLDLPDDADAAEMRRSSRRSVSSTEGAALQQSLQASAARLRTGSAPTAGSRACHRSPDD